MAVFAIKSFGGISPKVPARYLQDNQAQVAINSPVFSGSLQPLADVGTSILTLPKVDTPRTIYRYGQDVDSDDKYWFHWPFDVDVCRGQIAGDPVEWTFFTGDGPPKATYNAIAVSGNNYPAASIPLGLPAPKTPLQATADPGFDPTADYPAIITLDLTALTNLTDDGLEISLDGGTTFTPADLTGLPATNRASFVATAINDDISGVTAEVNGNNVVITTDASGGTVTMIFRGRTGSTTSYDTTSNFTYNALNLSDTGAARQIPVYEIKQSQWAAIASGDRVRIYASGPSSSSLSTCIDGTASGTFATAANFASFLSANFAIAGSLTINTYGSSVIVTPATYGVSTASYGGKIRFVLNALNKPEKQNTVEASADTADPARIFLTKTDFDSYIKGKFVAISTNGNTEEKIEISENASLFSLVGLPGCVVTVLGDDSSALMIETATTGTTATITLKGGAYTTSTTFAYFTLSAAGYTDETSIPESRVYTYTWVSNVSNFEFESGPADPSTSIDVFVGQSVTLSNFEPIPSPTQYTYTARRIYRSVNGTYLFVAEIPATQTSFEDTVAAEDLNEEMIVTGWKEPPAALQGLINLPNGIMAGFVGRDVYFCDPYHPHAWPESYVQTVDFPIVGLGRMDTTLAVLTKGTPYFIQGSHPDSMVVVKSDLQQSCAAKRSIVSTNGVVIYASPDGLVMLSSSGSKLITENMFTRAQWQAYFKPESIHAYTHDLKYVAFYDNGTTQGGFIFDLTSGQFILHDIYATAGYSDLLRDELYVAFSDRSLKKWLAGSNKSFVWRSKKLSLPEVGGFMCAQVEAEGYPITAKFYCDDSTTPILTKTVSSRDVFRLPAKVGRDWEIQLEGNTEVFNVAMGQSPEELAGA